MTSGIIYARHSTKKQAESADDQIANGLADFAKTGIELAHAPFVDRAKSGGKTVGRDGFMAMVKYADANPVDFVWIWSIARFAREFNDGMHFFTGLERTGAKVISHVEILPDGPMRGPYAAFLFMAAADMKAKISADTSRGFLSKILDRGYWKGNVPMGYKLGPPIINGDKINHRIVPDPKTAGVVKKAWKLRSQKLTIYEVWKRTRIGISVSTLRDLFRNPIYAGTRSYKNRLYPDYCEPLIDKETWDKVQTLFRPAPKKGGAWQPEGHPQRAAGRYPLSGVLFCGLCGGRMSGTKSNSWRRYACPNRREYHSCNQPYAGARQLEKRVLELVASHISEPDVLPGYEQFRADWLEEQGGRMAEIRHARERLSELDTAMQRLLDAIEAGGDMRELRERLEQRREERKDAQAEIVKLESLPESTPPPPSPEILASTLDAIRSQLRNPDHDITVMVVRWIVERVDYNGLTDDLHLTVKRGWYASI